MQQSHFSAIPCPICHCSCALGIARVRSSQSLSVFLSLSPSLTPFLSLSQSMPLCCTLIYAAYSYSYVMCFMSEASQKNAAQLLSRQNLCTKLCNWKSLSVISLHLCSTSLIVSSPRWGHSRCVCVCEALKYDWLSYLIWAMNLLKNILEWFFAVSTEFMHEIGL